MTKPILHILLMAGSFFVLYLLGVFYTTSFNITEWTPGTRFAVILFWAAHVPLHGIIIEGYK